MENNKYNYINEFLEGVSDGYISHLEMYSRIQDITGDFDKIKLKILKADIESKIEEIGHFIDIYSVGIDEPEKDYEIQLANIKINFLVDAIDYINNLIEKSAENLGINSKIEWKGTKADIIQKTNSQTENYPDILTSEKAFKVIDHYCKTYNSNIQYDFGCLYHMSIKKNFWKTRPTKINYIDLLIQWGYLTQDEFDRFNDLTRNPIPSESRSLMGGRDKNFENSYKLYFL